MMRLMVWSAVVSFVYAMLAVLAPEPASVLVVAFIALLLVPALVDLGKRRSRE
jgi:xanthosine utilization system XapX-like protein